MEICVRVSGHFLRGSYICVVPNGVSDVALRVSEIRNIDE